ncbi:aminoglycoside 6'-N-acetyltransferase [Paenibacillus uliginis N3/975]|uniref:Aminoglycoside 6'-N-acetyltransferase n=1 Tax=Paenibacillus uliginis N3/975 TaxID=1313296 RepID=A0A1X7H313_9BACL|nr:GNAT family N-acetyltransferase [Paenibacillus uliginis]SMF78936.1 aminoglycoside 6'-N-acetyltransferase [Paenibacillus uliginis N3/975]
MNVTDKELIIRKMRSSSEDFDLLEKWLNDEEVQDYYEGKGTKYTREQIIHKFESRASGKDYVIPCIIEYLDHPIGYIQYYLLTNQELEEYGANNKDVYGIDLFIGETKHWNKGLGTKTLELVIKYLFEELQSTAIFIDPQTWNHRAIRCYEKCGFRKVKVLERHELHEGVYKDNQIMMISSEEYYRQSIR